MTTTNRANRVAVNTTNGAYVAKMYRTHKLLATIEHTDTEWKPNPDANNTANRESFRAWICQHASEYGIEWNPAKQTQAWERKHNIYMEDDQVAEDATTLIQDTIGRLVSKGKYQAEIVAITMTDIRAKESKLTYVEDGKYTKNGAWCTATIEMEIAIKTEHGHMAIIYNMEMVSGQIKKPKTTIAQWNEMVTREMELEGIEVA